MNVDKSQPMSEMFKLRSKDGELFEVEKAVALKMEFLNMMNEDIEITDCMEIPVGEINSGVLGKVIEFCKFLLVQELNDVSSATVERWEQSFINVEQSSLFEIIMAANFLNVPQLLDLACKTVAGMISGKTADEIRELFDIENDFTLEALEEVRRDNSWCRERH